ncbi:sensor histidine kinase [Thalassomonas viridans]|uniref:histidine kinase n=1 Tax=Thalassomonas viridans TaxID=137584 RepID=A0AAF0CAP5_9GAMM|nr:sensor histidine kinase [Thalassomonas viridans]WDE07093.1 sensor histidine kinase [Thalassomonas viridans]
MKALEIKLFAVCFLLIISQLHPAYAQQYTALPHDADHFDLAPYAKYYLDNSEQQTLEQLIRLDHEFVPLAEKRLTPWPHTIWIKTAVKNESAEDLTWYLHTGTSWIPQFKIFSVSNNQSKQILALDDSNSFADRTVQEAMLIIPIKLKAGEQLTLYLTYSDTFDIHSLELFSPTALAHYLTESNLFNGMVFGALLFCFGIIAMQMLIRPKRSSAYLLCFILFGILFLADISGYTLQYSWLNYHYVYPQLPAGTILMVLVSYFLFIAHILRLKRNIPYLYRMYLAIVCSALAIIAISPVINPVPLVLILSPIAAVVSLATIYLALKRHLPLARLYSFNLLFHVGFINVLFVIRLNHIDFPLHVHSFTIPKTGFVLEVLMFVVILAYREHLMNRQQQTSLQQQLESSRQLARMKEEKNRLLAESQQRILDYATHTHDMAQPIATLKMAIKSINKQENTKLFEHIDNTINYTQNLFTSIINTAKGEYREITGHIQIQQLFDDLYWRHSPLADKAQLTLKFVPSSLKVFASYYVLSRILDNLITNAIRYAGKGKVFIGVRRRQQALEIQVLDNGPGISSQVLERISRPFEQLDKLRLQQQGFGLGMYSVKELCAKEGYRLKIASEQGKGCCFSINLPQINHKE